jgi:hypothetical protein
MQKSKPTDHERFDISIGPVLCFLAVLAVGALLTHTVLWDWLKNMKGPAKLDTATRWNPAAEPAAARFRLGAPLQQNPKADWIGYRAREESNLHSYGWIDRKRGIARVPIEVAMQQVVDRGLPRWTTNQPLSPLQFQQQRAVGQTKGGP